MYHDLESDCKPQAWLHQYSDYINILKERESYLVNGLKDFNSKDDMHSCIFAQISKAYLQRLEG